MPSVNGKTHELRLVPSNIRPGEEVFVLRFTGEVFRDYEHYLGRLNLYRQRIWTCSVTGDQGLTYEEALTSEFVSGEGDAPEQLPEKFLPEVARVAQHALEGQECLVSRLESHFRDHFLPEETVVGTAPGLPPLPCRIVSCLDRDHEGIPEYEVEWLQDEPQPEMPTQLPASSLVRKDSALTRIALRWSLRRLATCSDTGPPLWHLRPHYATLYGISEAMSPELVQRVARQHTKEGQGGADEAEEDRLRGIDVFLAASQAAGLHTGATGNSRAESRSASPTPVGRLSMDGLVNSPLLQAAKGGSGVLRPGKGVPVVGRKDQLPIEPIKETEARLPPRSLKHGIFQALKEAGPEGASLTYVISHLADAGIKTWDEERIAKGSISSTCAHDPAFIRIGVGRFALRAISRLPEMVDRRNVSLNQKAASAAAAVAAKHAEVLSRLAVERGVSRTGGRVQSNNFRCPRCQRGIHPEGSPLVLCDACPRAYHLICMPVEGMADLPAGEWRCPKCLEREEHAGRKLAGFQARQAESLQRVADLERQKDERLQRLAADKERRDAVRASDFAEKQRARNAEREERDAARAARDAARRVNKQPMEDYLATEEEIRNLGRLETVFRVAQEQATQNGGADAAALPEPSSSSSAAAAVAAAQAALEQQRLVVAGPSSVQLQVIPEEHWGPMADAMAIVEFARLFGPLVDLPPVSLQGLRAAVQWPVDSKDLPRLYKALLRCLLSEQAVMSSGAPRSAVRRWTVALSDATWAEVLRRHLITSRAGVAVPLAAVEGVPHHRLDDQAVAVLVADLLLKQAWHTLGPALHLRLLAALVNDLASSAPLRRTLAGREAALASLATDRQKEVVEEKKAAKERLAALREEERLVRETAAGVPQLPWELQEYRGAMVAGHPEDADAYEGWQVDRHDAIIAAATAAGELPLKAQELLAHIGEKRRAVEEDRIAAEGAHEAVVADSSIRSEPLGSDRHDRHYWWRPDEGMCRLFVEDGSGTAGMVTSSQQVEALHCHLNPRGLKERRLRAALERHRPQMLSALIEMDPPIDLASMHREASDRQGEGTPEGEGTLEAQADTEVVQQACATLECLLSQLYNTFSFNLQGSLQQSVHARIKRYAV